MKWLLSVLCFTTVTAFSQTDKPLLEKLKKTQENLKGKSPDAIPNPGLGLDQRIQKPPIAYKDPQSIIIYPKKERPAAGSIPNAMSQFQYKPRIIAANEQSMVIALPQDNMPCLVPNMKLYKAIPNAGNKSMLQNPNDADSYLQKPGS